MCCRNYLKCRYSGRVCCIVDTLWFGKSSDAGSNVIVEVGLRTGDLLGNCWEKLISVLRNPSHRGHRMLLLQQCNHQIFSDCRLFFIAGTKVTKCAVFLLFTEWGRRLVGIYQAMVHTVSFSDKNQALWGKGKGYLWGEVYPRASRSDQPPCCRGYQLSLELGWPF